MLAYYLQLLRCSIYVCYKLLKPPTAPLIKPFIIGVFLCPYLKALVVIKPRKEPKESFTNLNFDLVFVAYRNRSHYILHMLNPLEIVSFDKWVNYIQDND